MMDKRKQLEMIFCASLITVAILLFIPAIQSLLIFFCGKIIGRTLNHPEIWIERIYRVSFCFILFSCIFMLFIFNSKMKTNQFVNKINPYIGLLIIAFFTSTLFSVFPLGPQWTGTDSSVFIYIGQGMHNGKVPYKDMFDHKGLYLYFLEFFGTFFSGFWGIYIIEVISIFLTSLFLYKTAKLVSKIHFVNLFVVFFIVYFLGRKVYEGGNLTEEYALPCISYSNYIFLKYLITKNVNFKEIVIVGVTFTFVLFLRVNMVAPWIFYVLYLFTVLLNEKKNSELRKMIFGFSVGTMATCIPLLLYLIFTHSFYDMVNSYIIFNFKYISDAGGILSNASVAILFAKIFFIPCGCFLLEFFSKKELKYPLLNFTVFIFTLFFVVISGRPNRHYGIILLPFFVFPISHLFSLIYNNVREKRILAIKVFISVFSILFVVYKIPIRTNHNENKLIEFLKNEASTNSNVLVLGNDVQYYINSKLYYNQRFFYQLPVIEQNPNFMDEFLKTVKTDSPDYVIIPNNREYRFEDSNFSDFFNMLYDFYDIQIFEEGSVYTKKMM